MKMFVHHKSWKNKIMKEIAFRNVYVLKDLSKIESNYFKRNPHSW